MSEYTPGGPLVVEGIIEDGEFRQTNGQSFIHWLAAHDRVVRAEALREAADSLAGKTPYDLSGSTWLRARADQITLPATVIHRP